MSGIASSSAIVRRRQLPEGRLHPTYVPEARPGKDRGYCIGPLGLATGDYDLVGFPIDSTETSPYDLLGFLVPAGSTVDMELIGGTHVAVPVVADGLALYAGPLATAGALATVTLPDQRQLYCAPGMIATPKDVEDLDAADADQVHNDPWNCLFAADLS